MALRRRLRSDANQAVAIPIHAVDSLFADSFGKAIDNPMQRMLRDIHALRG